MPFGMGVGELIIVLGILLLVFGAKRLPELGGALGKGIREFKSSVRDIEGELKNPPADQRREMHRPTDTRPAVQPPAAPASSEPRAEERRPAEPTDRTS